jgi:hypothetical protein
VPAKIARLVHITKKLLARKKIVYCTDCVDDEWRSATQTEIKRTPSNISRI